MSANFLQSHSHVTVPFLALAVLGLVCALLRLGILIDLTTSIDNIGHYVQSEFDQVIRILGQLCHCFEYITLIYGLWRLRQNLGSVTEHVIQSIKQVAKPGLIIITNRMKSILYGLLCHSSRNAYCLGFCSSILEILLLILVTLSIVG